MPVRTQALQCLFKMLVLSFASFMSQKAAVAPDISPNVMASKAERREGGQMGSLYGYVLFLRPKYFLKAIQIF